MATSSPKGRIKVPCRSCGRPIRRSVVECPYCRHQYRSSGDSQGGGGQILPPPPPGGSGGGSAPPVPPCGKNLWTWLQVIWIRIRAAGAGIKRALGIDLGEPPLLVGQLTGQKLVQRESSDRPRWARIVRAGATVPALVAFVAIAMFWTATRPFFLWARLMTGSLPGFAFASMSRGLLFGAIAGALGLNWLNRRKARRVVWLLELQVGSGRRAARLALPENHGYDIVNGDWIEAWGREHRDGTLRASKLLNTRTGQTLKPRFVHPAIWMLYAIGAGALLFIL